MKREDDLYLIKKYYGEDMMHFCRFLFPTLLETPGLLFKVLSDSFAYTKDLYSDIVKNKWESIFSNYIVSLANIHIETADFGNDPKELLASVGYDLYECSTEKDIQRFKKYYAPGEELCTFKGGRLRTNYVFFAVKKNVDEIKREDFTKPRREDKYSTSVMSIQFNKLCNNMVSIKSRYNHTISSPDAIYSNDLEKICPGLTKAFIVKYPFLKLMEEKLSNNVLFPGYVKANDGKYYKFNMERGFVYYCPDNIIIKDGEVKRFDKNKYILFLEYLLDIENKTIINCMTSDSDSFTDSIGTINKINIRTIKDGRKFIFINDNLLIILNKFNELVEYHNDIVVRIDECFLRNCKSLQTVSLSKVEYVDFSFLEESKNVSVLHMPRLKHAGDSFMSANDVIKYLYLPNLEVIESDFLSGNNSLISLSLPKAIEIEDAFLMYNETLKRIYLPLVKKVGSNFLDCNSVLKKISLPNLEYAGDNFMSENYSLEHIDLPKLEVIEDAFLYNNTVLKSVSLPNVISIGDGFLRENEILRTLYLPNVETIGDEFLGCNLALRSISLPSVSTIGSFFLEYNKVISSIDMPNVEEVADRFLSNNTGLEVVSLPELRDVGSYFLYENKKIKSVYFPNLSFIDNYFMALNNSLKRLYLPNLECINDNFLKRNNSLTSIYLPKVTLIAGNFLEENKTLRFIYLPLVETIDGNFLYENSSLRTLYVPNLYRAGYNFMARNTSLEMMYAPELLDITYDFLRLNNTCREVTRNDPEFRLTLAEQIKAEMIDFKQELEKRAKRVEMQSSSEYTLCKKAA